MVLQNFKDPDSITNVVELNECKLTKTISDYDSRKNRIPEIDKYYVDLGIQYRLAQLIDSKINAFKNDIPVHVALKGHMGTGKDHDIEQFAAKLKYPYYRIPLSGEVRDVTLLGSVQLYGDGMGGTESKWQDGELTRALRGPAIVNLSELNAAGPEVLFALHSLLDRHKKLELTPEPIANLPSGTIDLTFCKSSILISWPVPSPVTITTSAPALSISSAV